jgi:hypothetical protein
MELPNIVEIPSFFGRTTAKKITFGPEGINIEKTRSFDPAVFIPGENINAFRYGVTWIDGYKVTFGRRYFIELKGFDNKIFRFKLVSLYCIKRDTYHKKWSEIFDQLWRNYFSNMLNYYVELFNVGQPFELAGVKFLFEGISWDSKNKLLWHQIALSNYKTYFMVYNADNPSQHKSATFATDWNAFVLQCLLKEIVEKHKQKTDLP